LELSTFSLRARQRRNARRMWSIRS